MNYNLQKIATTIKSSWAVNTDEAIIYAQLEELGICKDHVKELYNEFLEGYTSGRQSLMLINEEDDTDSLFGIGRKIGIHDQKEFDKKLKLGFISVIIVTLVLIGFLNLK